MSASADTLFESLRSLQAEYEHSLPPVEQWHPQLSGDFDMRIDREGKWFHEGGQLTRPAMVKMFASILKREGDEYFLVTPVEKWRIKVDEAPFVFVALRTEQEAGVEAVVLTTNIGNDVLIGPEHPLWMEQTAAGEPRPMALVHHNLPGLLNRNVFYQLVDLCEVDANNELVFTSYGERYSIGSAG
ncbi:MAG: DUF1285 domain-containing protein [Gammaproteobacteria bacterium]|nr:DUF1285 domain-containing protein [Gammaproteobacteria bacterium]